VRATDLYNQLEKDFVTPEMKENWYDYMNGLDEYICDNFKQRSIGLLCDFAEEITKVYTAVFPSDNVLTKVLEDNIQDAMIFLHHPLDWDLSLNPDKAFYEMNPALLAKLKERRIALFNFHYPLDNYGEYGNSKTLAEAMDIKIQKPFAKHCGAFCGVIGITDCKDVYELNIKYSQAVGHETKLYKYGDSTITDNKVAIVAGGGNDAETVNEIIENGINVFITGLSQNHNYSHVSSREAHALERENKINLLGGTHYSSEKFGCIAMCGYFEQLGLESEFINGTPCFEDL